eukprot:TRINITY_DN18951_c0_g1_i1.p1 TRINITY_DN18951_c0_g1~~TRINITY_DN18951_c0_g1_i1.p1  ORF type:complete len:634 (-),score=141.81 TRINITY_DN18951_c0_g1_i1:77-1978(-)
MARVMQQRLPQHNGPGSWQQFALERECLDIAMQAYEKGHAAGPAMSSQARNGWAGRQRAAQPSQDGSHVNGYSSGRGQQTRWADQSDEEELHASPNAAAAAQRQAGQAAPTAVQSQPPVPAPAATSRTPGKPGASASKGEEASWRRRDDTEKPVISPPTSAPKQAPSPQPSPTKAPVAHRPQSWADLIKGGGEKGSFPSSPIRLDVGSLKEMEAVVDTTPVTESLVDYIQFLVQEKGLQSDRTSQRNLVVDADRRQDFDRKLDGRLWNIQKAKYARRGMRNDANNCYANVAFQGLLSCSGLMQFLSLCDGNDTSRPFHSGMVRLCKEFYRSKKDVRDMPINILELPFVKEVVHEWLIDDRNGGVGRMQDAGEFLFHVLDSMHEENKWKAADITMPTLPCEGGGSSEAPREGAASGGSRSRIGSEDIAQVGKSSNAAEIRSVGMGEDSPVYRIFGGLVRSSVRSKGARSDSVSLEPFTHQMLDISGQSVTSVYAALDAFTSAEEVNDGSAVKRNVFRALPEVFIVCLKRFAYDASTHLPHKVQKEVSFDETLVFNSNWLEDGVEAKEYHLASVIYHHGTLATGGHYTAAVRYNRDWYLYDDTNVRHVDPQEVFGQRSSAYLLVYHSQAFVDVRP